MNLAKTGSGPSFEQVRAIANAIAYEGYTLYPYRPSSLKNRVRWNFGGVYPRAYAEAQTGADAHRLGCECIVHGASTRLNVEARFLEALAGEDEARPHSVRSDLGAVAELVSSHFEHTFRRGSLEGVLVATVEALTRDVFRLKLSLENESPCAELARLAALPHTLLAAHLLLGCEHGEFVSLLDPPAALAPAVLGCAQNGLWPVLAGAPGNHHTMLASPIILYDYPEIAPESRADSCDGTEIDEILLLRVLTLSADEKHELRASGSRARSILERAEALTADEQMRLHGRLRDPVRAAKGFRAGDRVRLRPKARADIFDLALEGKVATVRKVETDFEDRIHLSVTIDDDPGADLGELGLPGHCFFFFADEVEKVVSGGEP